MEFLKITKLNLSQIIAATALLIIAYGQISYTPKSNGLAAAPNPTSKSNIGSQAYSRFSLSFRNKASGADFVVTDSLTGVSQFIPIPAGLILDASLATVSPDGHHIAYMVAQPEDTNYGRSLRILNTTSDVSTEIVNGKDLFWIMNPLWSPAGDMIAYARIFPDRSTPVKAELWIYQFSTQQDIPLVIDDAFGPAFFFGRSRSITWSSDGSSLYFLNEIGDLSLYSVSLAGNVQQIDINSAQGNIVPELYLYLEKLTNTDQLQASSTMRKPLDNLADYYGQPNNNGDPNNPYSTAYLDNYTGDQWEGLGTHPGVDIPAGCGTAQVRLVAGGEVWDDPYRIWTPVGGKDKCSNNSAIADRNGLNGIYSTWGNHAIVRHNMTGKNGYPGGYLYSVYAHLFDVSICRQCSVPEGILVGTVGSTGNSSGSHLHFQLDIDSSNQIIPSAHTIFWNCNTGCNNTANIQSVINSTRNPMMYIQAYLATSGVTVFSNSQYSGNHELFTVNDPFLKENPVGEVSISSARVPSGWILTVCTDYQFGGTCRDITSDTPDFSAVAGLNDSTKSLKVQQLFCPGSIPVNKLELPTNYCGTDPNNDTTPPTGTFTAPSNGSTINNRNVTISVNASDDSSGVREVRFSAKWNNTWSGIGTDSSAPYSINWDMCSSGVPDGDVEIGMEVWDNAGNVYVWSHHGSNPHINKNYSCSGGNPITGDGIWNTEAWQNRYLAGYVNWQGTLTWTNFPYIYWDFGSGGPFGWGGDDFSMRLWRNVYFPGGYYDFHVTHDDGARVYVDGNKIIDAWWDGNGGHDGGINLSAGYHEVKVEYYENIGSAIIEVHWYGPGYPRPDNNPPNGRISSPANMAATGSSPLSIWAEASDDVSGVDWVKFFAWYCVSGSCDWHLLGSDYSAPYSYDWYWGGLTDQHVWLSIHIQDKTGKLTTDAGGWVEVDLDRTSPTIAFTSPGTGPYLTSSSISLGVNAGDTGSGINAVQFFAGYPGDVNYWHEIGWDSSSTGGWTLNWSSAGIPDQPVITFFAYAYDKAGNYQGAISSSFVMDRTPPTSSIDALPVNSLSSFSVTWSGQDLLSGIATFDIQVQDNAGAWTIWQNGTTLQAQTYSGQQGHSYAFRSRARDNAGNLEAWPAVPDTMTTVASAPSNDQRSSAMTVSSLPYAASQSTIGATLEVGEPAQSCGYSNTASVWYRYTASARSHYVVDTYNSNFDTVLHIYEENSGLLTLLGCNDDTTGLQSEVIFQAQTGKTYWIGITSYANSLQGSLSLNIKQRACPGTGLCLIVKKQNLDNAYQPHVTLLDSSQSPLGSGYGDSIGYVVIDPAPVQFSTLVASANNLFLVNQTIHNPGIFTITSQGKPLTYIFARDLNGNLMDADVVFAQSADAYGFVGKTYSTLPLAVYYDPGIFDISILAYDAKYMLALADVSLGGSGSATPIELNAQVMSTKAITLDWQSTNDGFVWIEAPLTDTYYFVLGLQDGEDLVVSTPESSFAIWPGFFLWDQPSGTWWQYEFRTCCFATSSGQSTSSLTVGGHLSTIFHNWKLHMRPGWTGALSQQTEDSHGNLLVNMWQETTSAPTSLLTNSSNFRVFANAKVNTTLEETPPAFKPTNTVNHSGDSPTRVSDITAPDSNMGWQDIQPIFSVRDAIGYTIPGSLDGINLDSVFWFDAPSPTNEGTWLADVIVPFGPLQPANQLSTNIFVQSLTIPNDDFGASSTILTTPSSTSQITWAATFAPDDPVFPCTGMRHDHSVWYQYTPTQTQTLKISTAGSTYDTVLGIWSGARGNLVNIGCSDDSSGTLTSEITLVLNPNVVYYIEIATFSYWGEGQLNLSISEPIAKLFLPGIMW